MLSKPFAIALLSASALVTAVAVPTRAADLTISPKAVKQASVKPGKRPGAKVGEPGKADKAKRHDKAGQRQILTYNLYQDPTFKLNGALGDRRHIGAPPALNKFDSRFGQGVPILIPPRLISNHSKTPVLKLQEPENAGIDFSCRDKPFRSRAAAKELTACYKHNVDRSWKTQTYVSREYTDGSQKWGGGLAVRYAY